ncbi:MAG TPA: TadE/TadG family type IV pilus assembly protein, partial [Coriobacteriia bacterium]
MGVKERGSAAIETAVGVPAFLLFIALIIGAGRIAIARQAVEAAAAEGARSASIERTQAAAD